MDELREGWFTDPFGRHEARWVSAGTPKSLVRDGRTESHDDPPDEPPRRAPEPIAESGDPNSIPGRRIGFNGPSCLGMIGLLVLSLLIVLVAGFLFYFRTEWIFHANSTGNTGSQICEISQHVNAAPTEKCSGIPEP